MGYGEDDPEGRVVVEEHGSESGSHVCGADLWTMDSRADVGVCPAEIGGVVDRCSS